MQEDINTLVERPEGQRIWVVRASSGAFVGHFTEHSVVAIGHIDELSWNDGEIPNSKLDSLKSDILKINPERKNSSITSHVNQVRNFISEIKLDDLVVTVSHNGLTVGRITSHAFIEKRALSFYSADTVHEMTHNLRRSVVWGPTISRASIPAALEMSMLAHQTVFNIDKYWDSIYHLLYPCFRYGNRLYLSANIKQNDRLDNYSLSQFFLLLSGVEILAKELETDEELDYPKYSETKSKKLDLNISTKAEFMSPGTIWASVAGTDTSLLWMTAIYIMLFGGDIKIFKTDGIIDTKTRQKIYDRALKLIDKHYFKKVKEDLKLEVPSNDTSALKAPKSTRKSKTQTLEMEIIEPSKNKNSKEKKQEE